MKREVYFVERGSSPLVKTLWLIGNFIRVAGILFFLFLFFITQAVTESGKEIPKWYSQMDNENTLFILIGTIFIGYLFIWVARFINWWSREFI